MNILIACEFSGVVREAFRRRGHNAWSCDLLPTDDGSPYHIWGDAEDALWNHFEDRATPTGVRPVRVKWDMLIAFPPCTYLCNSGVRWLYDPPNEHGISGINKKRFALMEEAAGFFNRLLNNKAISQIAVENPVMHSYGRDRIRRPDQYIQPWQFGHPETKKTGLWLKNLPKLVPTKIVEGRQPRVHHASPGPERWKERSRTLQGIADAMAEQWGQLG